MTDSQVVHRLHFCNASLPYWYPKRFYNCFAFTHSHTYGSSCFVRKHQHQEETRDPMLYVIYSFYFLLCRHTTCMLAWHPALYVSALGLRRIKAEVIMIGLPLEVTFNTLTSILKCRKYKHLQLFAASEYVVNIHTKHVCITTRMQEWCVKSDAAYA